MSLFRRHPGLPQANELAALLEISAHQVEGQRLATATTEEGQLLALREALAIWSDQRWEIIRWQLIRAGKWDGETGTLTVTQLDGQRRNFALTDAGLFPQVFRERLQASIVVEQHLPAPGGELLITGRRSLAQSDRPEVVWHVLALGRTRLDDPAVAALAVRATEALKLDYDF